MDVVLHAGAHRTATTTLQHMMDQSRKGLSAGRIAYWGPDRTRSGLFQGLVADGPSPLPWQEGRPEARVALQAAIAEADGAGLLVVSDENILGSMREMVEQTRLYPQAGPRAARFARGFGARSLKIGLAIRSYDAWWASVLAWQLMRGGPMPDADLCDRLITQPRRWRHVIADLSHALPSARIVVWSHEALGDRPDLVVRRLTRRRPALKGARARLNPGPTLSELADFMAACGSDPGRLGGQGGRFMPFDPSQRDTLRAQYAEDLTWLAAGAGGLARYIDEPAQQMRATTAVGRGHSNDPEHRCLA